MSFKKVSTIEKSKIEIEFSIDKNVFDKQTDKIYRKNVAKMTIPGFRKGKAPRAIVEKMYGKGVFYEDAINELLPDAYADALKESGAEVVSRPDFEVCSVDDDGVSMKATVYVKPEVEIKDYIGIPAEKVVTEVTEDMVNDEINQVRARNARLIDITDRPAQLGDTVKIDFDGYADDKQFEGGKGEDYSLKLGSGSFIPGFEDQIVGHSIDDKFDVNVSFPENYNHKELAGKPAVFKVILHSIQFSELPELDNDFAVDVSDFNTLDEYKADVKSKIVEKNESSANNALEGQIIDGLLQGLTTEIPECMIDNEVENIIRERDYSLRSQGLDLNTYLKYMNASLDEMRAQLRPMGERQIKTRLALEKIAEIENIKPEESDITAEYEKMAAQYSMEIEKVKESLAPETLSTDIVLRKTIDFVKSKAVINEKTADEAEKENKSKEDVEEVENTVKPRKSRKTKAEKVAEEAETEAAEEKED